MAGESGGDSLSESSFYILHIGHPAIEPSPGKGFINGKLTDLLRRQFQQPYGGVDVKLTQSNEHGASERTPLLVATEGDLNFEFSLLFARRI